MLGIFLINNYLNNNKRKMKIEQQVCNLKLAKKLKELEIEQDSYFYWVEDFSQEKVNGEFINVSKNEYILLRGGFIQRLDLRNGKEFSAFTATELLEKLPEFILPETEDEDYVLTIRQNEGCWNIDYVYDLNIVALEDDFEDDNLCNALAKMLIYLKENNLIKN